MNVHPIADETLGNTSYLVDVGDNMAVSVDPRRDVAEHLAVAAERNLRIVAVLETHLHADFVSGVREIAAVTGADAIAAAASDLQFTYRGVHAGDRIQFAGTEIEVLATPGHTPEHVAFLATAGDRRAVFSGGSLIVGGAARTDLSGVERTEELARAQYASVRTISRLADDTALYPTHGGGSFCSTGPARSSSSTIGAERATNPLLGIQDEDVFVDTLLRGFGSYPRYFAYLREVNRSGPELIGSLPEAAELTPPAAKLALEAGAWLIDARKIEVWASAHAQGAISIELRDAFASWLGWVVPFGAPFMVMLEADRIADAIRSARRIGYDRIVGWLSFEAWRDAGLPTAKVEALDPHDALARAQAGAVLLDVRQTAEFQSRHLADAAHLELGDIIAGKTPDAREVITYCGHGERSATAASILEGRGIRVANLRGGTTAWRSAGLGTEP